MAREHLDRGSQQARQQATASDGMWCPAEGQVVCSTLPLPTSKHFLESYCNQIRQINKHGLGLYNCTKCRNAVAAASGAARVRVWAVMSRGCGPRALMLPILRSTNIFF